MSASLFLNKPQSFFNEGDASFAGVPLKPSKAFKLSISGLNIHDVLLFKGEETLSEPFLFQIILRLSEDQKIEHSLVGKKAILTIRQEKDGKWEPVRYVNGLVTSARLGEAGDDKHLRQLEIVLRPSWWFLNFTKDSQIFQKKSVIDIIKDLLAQKDIKCDIKASCGTKERSFCVQYQESYFDFISRLMQEEGISYFFKHDDKDHTMVLFDGATGETQKMPLEKHATFTSAAKADPGWLVSFGRSFGPALTSFAINDYYAEKPTDKLYTKQPGKIKSEIPMDVYHHPGYVQNVADAEKAAKRHLESSEIGAVEFFGETTILELFAGQLVTVKKCAEKALNSKYLITQIHSSYAVNGDGFRNFFKAIPEATPFRTTLTLQRPSIDGVMTAVVTGAKGDEICTDDQGRIKIKFYWDTRAKDDESSSCWVRVATPLAGKNWGFVAVPRVGQEVMVQFEEGDPERPVVVGCLYHADNKPAYIGKDKTKTAFKSRSTPKGTEENYNEIRFTDEKGKEEFYTQAEKDAVVLVKDNRTSTIQKGNDQTTLECGDRIVLLKGDSGGTKGKGDDKLTITKGSRTIVLNEGDFKTTLDKGSEFLTIAKGDQSIKISKGSRTLTIKGDDTIEVGGDCKISVKGKMTFSAQGGVAFDTPQNFEVKCGQLKVKANMNASVEGGVGIKLKGGATAALEGGASAELKSSATVSVKGGALASVSAAMVKL